MCHACIIYTELIVHVYIILCGIHIVHHLFLGLRYKIMGEGFEGWRTVERKNKQEGYKESNFDTPPLDRCKFYDLLIFCFCLVKIVY